MKPLYQYKQSGSFCSTKSRAFLDPKPAGERVKKLLYQRMQKNLQKVGATSSDNLLDINMSNEMYDVKVKHEKNLTNIIFLRNQLLSDLGVITMRNSPLP